MFNEMKNERYRSFNIRFFKVKTAKHARDFVKAITYLKTGTYGKSENPVLETQGTSKLGAFSRMKREIRKFIRGKK